MSKHEKIGAAGTGAIRTAELLIERHGAAALDFARTQMRHLAKKGAAEAAADWRAVVDEIEKLTRPTGKG